MKLFLLLTLLFSTPSWALNTYSISEQGSLEKLLKNIHPKGTASGIVVASPSRANPNYWYHWVRDAALVMRDIVTLYERARHPQMKELSKQLLVNYTHLVRKLQHQRTLTGLGEPKYQANGTGFDGPWGRPQNDGPALRAQTMITWANQLLKEGHQQFVRTYLYNPHLTHGSIIKNDLEYTSHNWRKANFDYWEEVKGHHFANMMAKYRALALGADLARRLGDNSAASWYFLQAQHIEKRLEDFWDGEKIIPTLKRVGGLDYKYTGIDITTVLATIHSPNPLYPLTSPKVQATVAKTIEAFEHLYPINAKGLDGVLMGRYPEDRYNGYNSNGQGHGWFLATFSIAEYFYKLAREYQASGRITINDLNHAFFQRVLGIETPLGLEVQQGDRRFRYIQKRLIERGDEFIQRADYHAGEGGHMSEQANRHHGFMQGATDLTWSYAAHLSALWARP